MKNFQSPEWLLLTKQLTAEYEVNSIRYRDTVRKIKVTKDLDKAARLAQRERELYNEGAIILTTLIDHWEGHPNDPWADRRGAPDALPDQ